MNLDHQERERHSEREGGEGGGEERERDPNFFGVFMLSKSNSDSSIFSFAPSMPSPVIPNRHAFLSLFVYLAFYLTQTHLNPGPF